MNVVIKRVLIVIGILLVCGLVFVAPRVVQHSTTIVQAPAITDCDGSCLLSTPVLQTKTFSQENWQFTVPNPDWTEREPPLPNIKVDLVSKNTDRLSILFIKESTDKTFTDYVVETVRAFTLLEFTINSVKQIVINDQRFILLQVSSGDKIIWNWLSVKDNFGYVLTCGARINVDAGSSQHDLCEAIAQTIRIQ